MVASQHQAGALGRRSGRRDLALLPVLLSGLLAFRQLLTPDPLTFGPSELEAAEDWFFAPTGGSPLLVYVLAAWFALRRLPRLRSGFDAPERRWAGVAGATTAAAGVLWAHWVSADQLLVPALALVLVSAGQILGGAQGVRAMALPALFLALFATPIPTPLLNAVVYPMQLFTAATVSDLLGAVGLAAQQSGVLILRPGATFYVIETCAGVRSVPTLLLTAFVYAEVFHRSRRRLLVLLALAGVIGVIVNLVRVITLVLLPAGVGQLAHTPQGVLMTILGVLLLAAGDYLLERVQPEPAVVARSSIVPAGDPPAAPHRRIAGLSLGLLALAAATAWLPVWPARPLDSGSAHDIPRQLDGWAMTGPALVGDEEFMGSTRFSSKTWRRYQRNGELIELYVGTNDRLKRYTDLVSAKTAILQPEYYELERRIVELDGSGRRVCELVLGGPGGERLLVHHWYEHVDGLFRETLRNALALDRGPWRREEPALVIRLATPIHTSTDALGDARRRLRELAVPLRDALDVLRRDAPAARSRAARPNGALPPALAAPRSALDTRRG